MTRRSAPFFIAIALCALSFAEVASCDTNFNNKAWTNQSATAIKLEGLPNAFKVNDVLYRGAQPTAEGFKELKKLGIKTVINLRAFHSDSREAGDGGLPVEEMSFKTWHPEEEDVVRFLKIVTDTNKTPVFVHCQHGSDRTGTMIAVYRVAVCGWTKDDAVDEMVNGGFGFHEQWQNLITFIRKLDIEAVKKVAGLVK